ncbi:amino acid ABC transporter permease [Metallumcola ferriviriculae]|uniref:Amino acid ABC transporter permease n=1 Tax=Metallumcola ferriviriculae TaxID=3039180 RepID=A0AAU0ULJ4_9FIRM|nr:amino acid ABC transporter permease [Desulfitibacteraceae bacterium MK1]
MSVSSEWQYVISSLPILVQGAYVTLYLSLGSMVGALVLGLLVALMRISKFRLIKGVARFYVSFFRGTPLLVQLLLFYYGLTSYNIVLDPLPAAYLGLILHFGAYISETFRATILSIKKGQWEAAFSLGMNYLHTFWHVILPQAVRISIPPLWNSFIDILKSSSLASVVMVGEITRIVTEQSAAKFIFMPYFMALALFYWIVVIAMGRVQEWLEQRLSIP